MALWKRLLLGSLVAACLAPGVPALAGPGVGSGGRTPPLPIQTVPAPPPSEVRLPAAPGGGPARPLTAAEAVRLALRLQPDLRIPAARVRAAAGRTIRARSGLLPSVDLATGYTEQDSLSSGGGTSAERVRISGGSQASVVLRQLVWDFQRTSSEVGAVRSRERAAEADLAAARADVAMQVRQAFHGYAARRELAVVARGNLENQRHNLALARARWESGLGLPADVVRAEAAVATATVSLNAATARAATEGVQLSRLLGLDPRALVEPAPEPVPAAETGDLDRRIAEALHRRPEMLAAEREVEAAEFALRAARVNAAPSLSANAGVTARGQDYPPDTWFFQYGLTMQWPLVDSGETAGLVQEAEGLLDEARARRDVVHQDVVAEIVQAHVELQTARDSLVAAGAAETNARESVRIAEGRYGAGLGSFLEVLDAQAALLTASNQLVLARVAAHQASAAFDRALGLAPEA